MTEFPVDPNAAPLGFVTNPQTGADLATGSNQPGPGYCPSCGRGDCAPTADEYEQQRQRAERVRKLHCRNEHTGDCEHCSARDYPDYSVPYPCDTVQALDEPGPAATQATDSKEL